MMTDYFSEFLYFDFFLNKISFLKKIKNKKKSAVIFCVITHWKESNEYQGLDLKNVIINMF